MGAAGSLISLLILAVISIAPLTISTFVGARMGYRGIGLIAPWIGAVALGLLVGFGMASLDTVETTTDRGESISMVTTSWAAALLVSGYFSTLVYLIVLAVRRLPSRPSDAANVF